VNVPSRRSQGFQKAVMMPVMLENGFAAVAAIHDPPSH
jgi:hypothetical protein